MSGKITTSAPANIELYCDLHLPAPPGEQLATKPIDLRLLNAFFSFGDEDGMLLFNGRDDGGKAIRNQLDARHFPDPTALSIRPALAEVLRLVADNLEKQIPVGIGVVICRYDALAGGLGLVGDNSLVAHPSHGAWFIHAAATLDDFERSALLAGLVVLKDAFVDFDTQASVPCAVPPLHAPAMLFLRFAQECQAYRRH